MKLVLSIITGLWLSVVFVISIILPLSDNNITNQLILHFLMFGILNVLFLLTIQLTSRFSKQYAFFITVSFVVAFSGLIEFIKFYNYLGPIDTWGILLNIAIIVIISAIYTKHVWGYIQQQIVVVLPKKEKIIVTALDKSANFG